MNNSPKAFLFIFLTLLLLAGCGQQHEHELRVAINPWIGYSPLYYAQEQGWLEEAGIKLIHSTSLNETIQYFNAGLVDAFVSTQYEASVIGKDKLVHLYAIDRSNGGDVVLSNKSLDEIIKSENITVYMEIDSVNQLVFDDFVNKHKLPITNFNIINKEQVLIKELKPDEAEATILITYEPYATHLRNQGFQQIGSTADTDILILDSLYTSHEAWSVHRQSVQALKKLILKSYQHLKNNPQQYHNNIQHYLEKVSYQEFAESLKTIEWLLEKPASYIGNLIGSRDILPIKN